jgi:hypothetical protein
MTDIPMPICQRKGGRRKQARDGETKVRGACEEDADGSYTLTYPCITQLFRKMGRINFVEVK